MSISISDIVCPYCTSSLRYASEILSDRRNNEWAVVKCECDEFPIIAGCLFLQKDTNLTNKKVVKKIRQGDWYSSFDLVLDESFFVRKLFKTAYAYPNLFGFLNMSVFLRIALRLSKHRSWIGYLKSRSGGSSDLRILQTVLRDDVFSGGIFVDLGAGNCFLQDIMRFETYVGIDHDFFSLALRLIDSSNTSGGTLICADVNFGIPLKSGLVSHLIFLDSFCYLYKKRLIVHESSRVLSSKGYLYLIGLYESTKQSDNWGYGVSKQVVSKWLQNNFTYVLLSLRKSEELSVAANATHYSIVARAR